MRLIYLASPFTHPDEDIERERFDAACSHAASMIRSGKTVYSPIAHSYPLSKHGLPGDWLFWEKYDREMLKRCDELVVLKLDGWAHSIGVRAEVAYAKHLKMPVRYVTPENRPDGNVSGRLEAKVA